jgi:hypothetical protein
LLKIRTSFSAYSPILHKIRGGLLTTCGGLLTTCEGLLTTCGGLLTTREGLLTTREGLLTTREGLLTTRGSSLNVRAVFMNQQFFELFLQRPGNRQQNRVEYSLFKKNCYKPYQVRLCHPHLKNSSEPLHEFKSKLCFLLTPPQPSPEGEGD